MSGKIRYLILLVVLFTLAGCASSVSTAGSTVEAVQGPEVATTLRYQDGVEAGPLYNAALTVPDSWVGQFEARNEGNALYFDYTGDGDRSPIFTIEALSPSQYWNSSGGYPNSHTNLVNRNDTFFVYYMPIEPYYAGLDEATFAELTAAVPEIAATFSAESAE